MSTGLNLLSDVLRNPAFPAAALEREREVQLAGIRAQKDDLLQSASKAMRRALFGDTGYGFDVLGTEASVKQLQVADLKAFHRQFAAPNNCVLAIYGDVKAAAIRTAVQKALGQWAAAPPPSAGGGQDRLAEFATHRDIRRVTEIRDKKQAVLVIGYQGATLHNPERYALDLLQEVCSDLGSRLFLRIREKLGLAYYVGAQNFVGLAPGCFAFYAGTAPDKASLVEQELLSEAELLRNEGLTEAELKRAKAKVIGQRKIARQDLGGLAMIRRRRR